MLGTFKLRAPELLFDNEPFVGSCEITKHQLRISEKNSVFLLYCDVSRKILHQN